MEKKERIFLLIKNIKRGKKSNANLNRRMDN